MKQVMSKIFHKNVTAKPCSDIIIPFDCTLPYMYHKIIKVKYLEFWQKTFSFNGIHVVH